jgi:nicotinate-nucleotide--dimethylbenzimidazole phosphoribosyltransferase
MVANFLSGGAAVNVLAAHVGATVVVVDAGVASVLTDAPGLVRRKVRAGTGDLAVEPAMTREEARSALDLGAEVAADLVSRGVACLLTGDMGIGNTTPSAALIAAFTGRPASEVTGRGTGIDAETWARKVSAVERGLARTEANAAEDPIGVLASLGGVEIAALVGYLVGGAAAEVPIILDGVIAAAAAVVAVGVAPAVLGYLVAGHRSVEPGASVALEHLGLEPVLDLGLRLGEGTGACLALPVVQAAAKILREMATFEAAGVSQEQG